MATKKLQPQTAHFHIPADPLRIKSEEIQARHNKRKEQETSGLKNSGVTNEMLYEMLSDLLERQEILEGRLQVLLKAKSR